jgi:sRNA-binding protein
MPSALRAPVTSTPTPSPAPSAAPAARPPVGDATVATPAGAQDLKVRFLAELQRSNRTFFSLHVAQAQRIDIDGDRVVFVFGPVHETMRQQIEQRRSWLESVAEAVAGRKMSVATAKGAAADPEATRSAGEPTASADLRARALADGGVQAMLDVFPAEIREVEEIR